jgi:acyl dehydratase
MGVFVVQPLYFADVAVGDRWRSPARTLTEADVASFAGLTGDFNPLHMDHNYARTTPFGRPIVHGLLGLSLVAGLGSNSPTMCTAAFVRISDWRFLQPIYFGDTVHVETEVVDKVPKGRRHGLVIWRRELVNRENNIVLQQGTFETLVKVNEASVAA